MINKFKKNHWYRFNGKAIGVRIDVSGYPHVEHHEAFMLDSKWHQCKGNGNFYWRGYFHDSPDPCKYCYFGDYTKPEGQDLYMFDELSPTIYNIKKLKELKDK